MGRPDYEDSVAGDSGVGSDESSTGYVYFGADPIGSLTDSDNGNLSTVLGTLQESDNGTT